MYLCILPADFKQALGQQSSKGPAPPCKLTAHQTQIVKALVEVHADDVEVTVTLLAFTMCVASKQAYTQQLNIAVFSASCHMPAVCACDYMHWAQQQSCTPHSLCRRCLQAPCWLALTQVSLILFAFPFLQHRRLVVLPSLYLLYDGTQAAVTS